MTRLRLIFWANLCRRRVHPRKQRKSERGAGSVLIWSAPTERSDDGALVVALAANLKWCGAPLVTTLQIKSLLLGAASAMPTASLLRQTHHELQKLPTTHCRHSEARAEMKAQPGHATAQGDSRFLTKLFRPLRGLLLKTQIFPGADAPDSAPTPASQVKNRCLIHFARCFRKV